MPDRARALCLACGALRLSLTPRCAPSIPASRRPAPISPPNIWKAKSPAARFVEGRPMEVVEPQAPLRREPRPDAPLETEALKGERVTVYEANDEGWAWGQLDADNYVGWLPSNALAPPGAPPTHKVAALRERSCFPGRRSNCRRSKRCRSAQRSSSARIEDRLAVTSTRRLCAGGASQAASATTNPISSQSRSVFSARPICGAARPRSVSIARAWCRSRSRPAACVPARQRHAGSGAGRARCARTALSDLKRGDLVFWKGHVAIVRDRDTLIHANAFHMAVAVEPIAGAVTRIGAGGSAITSARRIATPG